MSMRASLTVVRILCAVGLLAAIPPDAGAQTPFPRDLGGFVSGSFGDGGPAPGLGVTATIRVTRTLRFEVDGSYRPDLDFGQIPLCPPGLACILASETSLFRTGAYNVHARSRSATISLVSDLPIRFGALQPYVAAGGGFANVRRELRDTEIPGVIARTSTDPMLTVGGGVDVPLTDRFALGLDARFERVLGEPQFDRPDMPEDFNLARVGLVIRYRF
jgi:opacity protein-like surface antigen